MIKGFVVFSVMILIGGYLVGSVHGIGVALLGCGAFGMVALPVLKDDL